MIFNGLRVYKFRMSLRGGGLKTNMVPQVTGVWVISQCNKSNKSVSYIHTSLFKNSQLSSKVEKKKIQKPFSIFKSLLWITSLFVLLTPEPGVGVRDLNCQLSCPLHNQLPVLGGDIVGNLGTVSPTEAQNHIRLVKRCLQGNISNWHVTFLYLSQIK